MVTDEQRVQAIKQGVADADAARAAEGDQGREVEPAAVVGLDDATRLDAPERVVWADAAPPWDAAVVSVGEVGILAAPGGSGKSYLALHLAIMAASRSAPARACGLSVRPGPVLVASYEDTASRMGARARALMRRADVQKAIKAGGRAGLDDEAVARSRLADVQLVADPLSLWAPGDGAGSGAVRTAAFDALRRRAEVLKPSLIVIDPISAAGAGLNLNEGGAARNCMRDLAALSADTGAGVLVVAHDTKAARNEAKAGGNPGAGAVAGSGQWHDAARGVIYLLSLGRRAVECLKCNHGRAGWGVELAEVGGDGGRPFAGFERRRGGGWVNDMDTWRAARKDEAKAKTAKTKKAAPGGADGGEGNPFDAI